MQLIIIDCRPFLFSFFSSEDLPAIDTDSDLDESEDNVEKDSGQQISDCESESLEQQPPDLLPEPTNVSELHLLRLWKW